MKTFKTGSKVTWTETGKKGTVRTQFVDGYVSLIFDDGHPGELPASSLELSTFHGKRQRSKTTAPR